MAIVNTYFRWLYGRVQSSRRSYLKLSDLLHNITYTYFVPNDDNREGDARAIRDEYLDVDPNALFNPGGVSFFEMLVALTERLHEVVDEGYRPKRLAYWYRRLLEHMGLEDLTDEEISFMDDPELVDQMVNRSVRVVLDRTYNARGQGSLFPLKRFGNQDMRTVEIWYQMMVWFEENYQTGRVDY